MSSSKKGGKGGPKKTGQLLTAQFLQVLCLYANFHAIDAKNKFMNWFIPLFSTKLLIGKCLVVCGVMLCIQIFSFSTTYTKLSFVYYIVY